MGINTDESCPGRNSARGPSADPAMESTRYSLRGAIPEDVPTAKERTTMSQIVDEWQRETTPTQPITVHPPRARVRRPCVPPPEPEPYPDPELPAVVAAHTLPPRALAHGTLQPGEAARHTRDAIRHECHRFYLMGALAGSGFRPDQVLTPGVRSLLEEDFRREWAAKAGES